MSTVTVTAVTYLGFEYRSIHDGDRRGFTVKPTAKYVDECLDIVQLQNAKAVMTPLTEQKSLNLHDETTACDQVQHSLFRAVIGKLQYITGVRPDLMFVTKCLSYNPGRDWTIILDTRESRQHNSTRSGNERKSESRDETHSHEILFHSRFGISKTSNDVIGQD